MWFPEQLYTIDILFAAFVLLFVFSGIKNGLSEELAHVVTLIVLLAGICFFYPQIMAFATETWRALSPAALRIVVPVTLLLAAVLFFVVVRALFKQLFKSKLGSPGDKIAGGLIGVLRGALMGLVLFSGLSLIPNDALYQTLFEKSSIGAWVCNTLTPWAQPRIMDLPVLKDKMSEKLDDITQ
jgi:uncharacterized membrane protein required for colicin V production